jgi:transcriptional regulator with XRE-family HTH domain
MLGLEYALQVFDISYADLAKELGIDRSNITIWLSGKRPIPKKYLPKIAEKLSVPVDYLSKPIDDLRKLEIDNIKLINDVEYDQIEDTFIDEDGNEITYMRDVIVNGSIEWIEMNKAKIDYLKSIKRLQATLNLDTCENISDVLYQMNEHTKLVELFGEIMESKNKYLLKKVLNAILIYLGERKGIGRLYDFEDDNLVKGLVQLLNKAKEREKDELKWGKSNPFEE